MVITALIVDDEPDIRSLIALALGRIGLDTHTAANLEEATNLLAAYAFDVCLTDMRLPDGSGLDLVRHVRDEHPGLPIAVITAHGNTEAAVEAMKAGAFDFVSKPVDIGRLRGIVVQATERVPPPAHTVAPLPSGPSDSRRERRDPIWHVEHVHDLAALSGRRSASTGAAVLLGGERLIGRSASMSELRRLSRQGRTHQRSRVDHGRVRHRQGADRSTDPRERSEGPCPLRRDQLRRDSHRAHGKRAVRAQEGQLHRSRRGQRRPVPFGGRGNAPSRRGRRAAAAHAGETPPRRAGALGPPGRCRGRARRRRTGTECEPQGLCRTRSRQDGFATICTIG